MRTPSTAYGIAISIDELAATRTVVSEREAERYAQVHYGLDVRAKRLATEKDDTFRLDGEDGQFILKIANPAERIDEIDFQNALLQHIERVAPGLPVPRLRPNRVGEANTCIALSDSEQRQARLLSYIPGTPLDTSPSSVRLRENIGEILAQLRLALVDFSHSADTRAVLWDVTNVLNLSHLLGEIDDANRRCKVERTLEHFESVVPALEACRRQVLHNDFNANNIVVSAQNPEMVGGVIDFGDAVRTAIAVDVSTALVNQMPKQTGLDRIDLFDEARDVLRGYLRYAELTDEELRLIPSLAFGRTATRILLSYWRAKLFPDNALYILRHTEASWPHVDWFLSLSADQIAGLLIDQRR